MNVIDNNCTLTFDSEGGSAVTAVTRDYNTQVAAPAAPARTGYTFEGWYDGDNGTGSAVAFPYTLTEDKTVYAKWKTNTQNSPGGSDNTGGNSGAVPDTPAAPSVAPVIVIVNDKEENLGISSTQKEGDKVVVTISVNEEALENKLSAEGDNDVIVIPVNAESDIRIGELTGQMIKSMEAREAVVEVRTPSASYTIPAKQININALSREIGLNVGLKDIKVCIEISEPSDKMVNIVENSAKKGEFTVVAHPVNFSVSCTAGDKTVEVKTFSSYVERAIAIPEGVDPERITTGIIVEPDGTTRHVPTKVIVINGVYYAKINSLTNSTYSVVWHPMEFKDVTNHWAKEAINDMGSRMVIDGTGNNCFEPDRDITRAEFAAIIVRAMGLKPGTGTNQFKDVSSKEWYCDYIKTAANYNIISGYGNGKFGPMDKITREQAMTMIAQAAEITELKIDLKTGEIDKILKASGISSNVADWAEKSVAACIKSGIIPGETGKLTAPKGYITRAEVAQIVRQFLNKSGLI